MRKVRALAVASLLMIGSSSLAVAGPHYGMGMGMGPQYGGCMMDMGHRGGWGHNGGGYMGMFGALDLTPEQQQKMKDIWSQNREPRSERPVRQNMDDIYNLLTADSFDEAQVRKQIEERNKPQVDRQVKMAKIHYEMYQVLTPEQKAKVKSFHEQRMDQWKKRQEWRANNQQNKAEQAK